MWGNRTMVDVSLKPWMMEDTGLEVSGKIRVHKTRIDTVAHSS